MFELFAIIITGLGLPLLLYVPMTEPSGVCLIDNQQTRISVEALTQYSMNDSAYVQLITADDEIRLPANTYRLPLQVANAGRNCFSKPFYLLHETQGYQWINADGEPLYEVYWFDNGPDYPSQGLFRFKQYGKIGYADAQTFAIVIPAQFDAAFAFEQGRATVAYDAQSTTNDDEHQRLQQARFFTIDKQGRTIDE